MADEVIDNVARDVNAMELGEDQLARMRVPELKAELRQRHLRTVGRKRELLERLRAALLVERERVQEEEEEEEANDDDDEEEEEDDDGKRLSINKNLYPLMSHGETLLCSTSFE